MRYVSLNSSNDSGENTMILNALHITNFKAFANSQRVPLRPVTLIYGANSAGKSSILHALALAHTAISER